MIGASQDSEKLEPGKVVIHSSFSQLLDNTEDGDGVNHNSTCELSRESPRLHLQRGRTGGRQNVMGQWITEYPISISGRSIRVFRSSRLRRSLAGDLGWRLGAGSIARFGACSAVSLIFIARTMVQQAESAKAISTGVAFIRAGRHCRRHAVDIIRR